MLVILWTFQPTRFVGNSEKVPSFKQLCKWSLIFRCSNVYLPGPSLIAITDTEARVKRPQSDEQPVTGNTYDFKDKTKLSK